jgi:hypothetical protein
MRVRSWVVGTVIGGIAGLAAAIPMTISDWRVNPAGLFHDQHGTNWAVVTETAFSWFWPVALIALVTTVVIHSWLCRRRPGDSR